MPTIHSTCEIWYVYSPNGTAFIRPDQLQVTHITWRPRCSSKRWVMLVTSRPGTRHNGAILMSFFTSKSMNGPFFTSWFNKPTNVNFHIHSTTTLQSTKNYTRHELMLTSTVIYLKPFTNNTYHLEKNKIWEIIIAPRMAKPWFKNISFYNFSLVYNHHSSVHLRIIL